MSKSIDQRIVEMKFDNDDFEKGAQQSLSTLENLNKSIDMFASGESLKGLDAAAFDGFNQGLENVGSKFSWLEEIAVGALRRIGEKVADLGMSLLNEVNPLNQVAAGWQKYANETSAIQTLMSATRAQVGEGKRWKDEIEQQQAMEDVLLQLGWFADETSYSYDQMVSTMSNFVSQGVELDQAVESMQGIATWAGLSGVSVEKAETAFRVFSQAVGQGFMNLGQWRQIERINFTTPEFRKALLDTAVAFGEIEKTGDNAYRAAYETGKGLKYIDFDINSITAGLTRAKWLTKDVMNETLKKTGSYVSKLYEVMELTGYGTEYSYWDTTSQVLEDVDSYVNGGLDLKNIVAEIWGDENDEAHLKQLQELFNDLGSSVNEVGRTAFKSSQEAKTFREAIDSVGDAASTKWKDIFKSIFGNYTQAKRLWTDVANNLWDVFVGPIDTLATVMRQWSYGGGRDLFIEGMSNLWDNLAGNDEREITGLFTAISDGWTAAFGGLNSAKLVDITRGFRDFTSHLIISERGFEIISKAVEIFGKTLKIPLDILGFITRRLFKLPEVVRNAFSSFSSVGEFVSSALDKIIGGLDTFYLWVQRGESYIRKFWGVFKETDGYKIFMANVQAVGAYLRDKFAPVYNYASEVVGGFLAKLRDSQTLSKINSMVYTGANKLGESFERAALYLDPYVAQLKIMASNVGKKVYRNTTNIRTAITDLISRGPSLKNFKSIFTGFVNDLVKGAPKLKNKVATGFSDLGKTLRTKIEGAITSLNENLEEGQTESGMAKFLKGILTWSGVIKDAWEKHNPFDWIRSHTLRTHFSIDEILEEGFSKERVLRLFENFFEDLKSTFPIIDTIQDKYRQFCEFINKHFSPLFEKLSDLWENGPSKEKVDATWGAASEGVESSMSALQTSMLGIFDPKKLFGSGEGSIGSALSAVWETIKPIFDTIASYAGAGGAIVTAVGVILFVLTFLHRIGSFAKGWAGVGEQLRKTLKTVSNSFRMFQAAMASQVLLNIAEAIGILVLSLMGLTLIDASKLQGASDAMASIAIGLSILMFALAKFIKAKDGTDKVQTVALNLSKALKRFATITAFPVAMLALALGIGILAICLVKLAEIPWTTILSGLMKGLVIGGVLVGLVALLMLVSKKLGSPSLKAFGVNALALSLALGLLVPTILLLGLFAGSAWKGALIIAGVMLALAGSLALLGKVEAGKLGEISKILLALSLALGVFVVSVLVLSGQGPEILYGVGAIVAALASLMILGAVVGKWPKIADGMRALVSGFLLFSVSAVVFAGALFLLGQVGMQALPGILMMGGALLVLVGLGALIGHFTGIADGMRVLVSAFIMFSVGAVIFAGALLLLGQVATLAMPGLIAIGIAIGVLVVLGAIIAIFPTMALGIEAFAKSFLMFSGAILVLAAAVALLGSVGKISFDGIMFLGIALLVFLGVAALIGIFPPLAIGLQAIASVVKGFGSFFQHAGDGLAKFGNAIIEFGKKIADNTPTVFAGMVGFITAIALAIIATQPQVMEAIARLVQSIIGGLVKGIIYAVQSIIPVIWEAISEVFGKIKGWIAEKLDGTILEKIPGVKKFISDSKKGIEDEWSPEEHGAGIANAEIDGMANAFAGGSEKITGAAEKSGSGILGFLGGLKDKFTGGGNDATSSLSTALSNGAPQIETASAGLGDAMSTGFLSGGFDIHSFGSGIVDDLSGSLSSGASTVSGASSSLMDSAKGAFQNSGFDMSSIGSDLVSNLSSGELGASSLFQKSNEDVAGAGLESIMGMGEGFNLGGADLGAMFGEGFGGEQLNFEGITGMMGEGGLSQLTGMIPDFGTTGMFTADEYGAGIEGETSTVQGDTSTVSLGALGILEDSKYDSHEYGKDFGRGFGSGISSVISEVCERARKMVREAIDAANAEAQIQSPSRVMMKTGKYFDEGFAVGIAQNDGLVGSASKSMADTAINAMRLALMSINDTVDEDLNLNPVIRPVVDLSDVQSSSSMLDGMLGNMTYSGLGQINPNANSNRMLDLLSAMNSMMGNGGTTNIEINVTGGPNANARDIADEVMDRMNNELRRRKVAWG